ncbi:hypothetical protein [Pseudomonas vranovensis]|uniref:BIG2 domain-containing protein n=1 Tax=Pseudomonas vranovensis TaxID=321661 RepID=A0A423DGC7_9PSED|nr:hypothetical protein [Pseudomonas vranovensis]ROL70598.1 hypothetical protein BHU25_16180 [Pseudomonas vranovensis]
MNQDLPVSIFNLTDMSGLDDADLLPDYLGDDEVHSVEASRVHVPYMTPLVDHPDNLDGGITLALLQTSPHGLQVVVARYLQMAPGDAVHVYWGDSEQPASPSPYIVRPEDLDKPDFLIVRLLPVERIPEGISEVWYQVRPLSGNVRQSMRLRVKVRRLLPGGLDPDLGTPGHQGLQPPLVTPDLIGEEHARLGVEVYIFPWENMAWGDVIELSWGGVFVRHRVQAHEVDQRIQIIVDYDTIAEAGDADELVLIYRLIDDVGNYSADWSPVSHAWVEIGGDLPAPFVADADANGLIDLDKLAGKDVTVQVFADLSLGFRVGDVIHLKWRGFTEQGVGPIVHLPQPFEIPFLPYFASFSIPNAEVQGIARGRAAVSYEVQKTNGSVLRSKSKSVGIVGEPQKLQRPIVDEAPGQYLPDDAAQATVRIPPYSWMAKDQRLVLVWQGTRADHEPYLHEEHRIIRDEHIGEEVIIVVAAQHIVALAGGTLELYYRVIHDNGPGVDSERLFLHVGEAAPELQQASVDGAQNGVFDPTGLTSATVRIPSYTSMRPGQTVHLEWLGSAQGGHFTTSVEVTAPGAFAISVPIGFITPSLNREVYVRYWVVEAGMRTRYSFTLTLLISQAVLELLAPTVLQAPGGLLDPLQATSGATVLIRYTGMSIQDRITLHWTGTALGSTLVGPLGGNANGELTVSIPPLYIGANIGAVQRQVQVRYSVLRQGASQPQESQLLNLRLQPLTGLTQLQVDYAVGLVLDLDRFSGDTRVSVAAWSFARAGQRVWLRCYGTKLNGDPEVIELIGGAALDAGEVSAGLSRVLARNRLLMLRDNSELRVELKVNFTHAQNEADAVNFPVLRLTLRAGFSIAPEPLVLNGSAIRVQKNWQLIQDFPANTAVRQATGGRPPYTYHSANTGIATVDTQGKVTGARNGSTVITVHDADQRSAFYSVQVSNVRWLNFDETSTSYATGYAVMQRNGGNPVSAADEVLLQQHYGQPFPDLLRRYFFLFTNGQCPGSERGYEVGSANTFRCIPQTTNAGGWYLTVGTPSP